MIKPNVLVAYDFSPASEAALAWAANLVRSTQGTLTALYLLPVPLEPVAVESVVGGYPSAADLTRAKEDLENAMRNRGVPVRAEVTAGPHAGDAIVAFAERAKVDLLVMGTRGRGGVARAVLGSTADYVVRHAACPVVTMRDTPEAEALVSEERRRESGLPGGGKGRRDEVSPHGVFPYSVQPSPPDADPELRTPDSLTPSAPYDESGRSLTPPAAPRSR